MMDKDAHTRVPGEVMERLADLLVERELLTRDRVDEFRDRATWLNQDLDRIIAREGAVPERDMLDLVSEITGVPVVRIAETGISTEAVDCMSPRIVSRFHVMPIGEDDSGVTVAADRVHSASDEDQLRVLLGRPVQWRLCTANEIRECIKHYYGVAVETFISGEEGEGGEPQARSTGSAGVDISRFVSEMVGDAVRSGATDIHLEPYEDEWRLRYRIDGVLSAVRLPPGAERHQRAVASALKVMAQINIAEHRLPQDGRFTMTVDGEELDVRVSVLPTRHGEAVDLRLLNREATFLDLEQVGLNASQRGELESLIALPNGIVLFTGPTGSGKTTSLYAALASLNEDERKIITIEDPVEYQIRGITQLQVEADIGFTFASGLRSVLRHDPDVILVGEIRDIETANIAIRSALTGHLVFSTLHTNDSAGAVVRLVDMGIEPYLVASSVQGVIAQRLLRCICAACSEERPVEPWAAAQMQAMSPEGGPIDRLMHGMGCPDCRFTGYQGRRAIFETLVMNDAIRALVVERRPTSEIMRHAVAEGLQTLQDAAWACVRDGSTTVEEVLRVTRYPG